MSTIRTQALHCRDAAQALAQLSAAAKQALLEAMAAALEADAEAILAANARDLEAARAKNVGSAMLDRLALDGKRLAGVAAALREVAALPDPVGQVTRDDVRPNGIRVQKVRVPLGVIAMIYEARPNVTADAAALCIKAGNGVILRGGSEAIHSNTAIAAALRRALREAGIGEDALTLVEDLRRETMLELLQLNDIVDLAIPRGGEGLIRFVAEHARVPVIKHYKGVCHLFVDASADLALAVKLLVDGKTTRPAACNALETLLVHADIAARFLPLAAQALQQRGVALRGDDASRKLLPDIDAASDADYAAEFLDLILAIRVVPDLDAAIAHIRHYGSDHTEVIATADAANAEAFVQAMRAAVVMVNASSRFSDGGELGLGAEIGISTTRLHAYGPMGLEALTVERFVVRGAGQVRH
ncbi:glutamate-5-semialdehyde dehydrogenase [Xanthomonas graminis]|jgi:glutamate-5-semialdehyde dehydrogenase|uniref:Gamma-glutamyl phosphate reductase n=1 Tax=Xanthomonas graminis pv. graminis TaxID=134874 RepID=A0A1M4JJ65_9XANT|nr:glutamate-5-semialdehyde dehydrogenase [Xanthomonas translucens]EKU24894.1 gamma-glutamyl phosphate reductase [Xanthomonas translucens pv. graminis ART-Xtg29]OAX61941.1 gamma-glutamyl-phosphate reductase [Xanthomonas translucens pv. graminis]UKE55647.1 glutamate-5-semialdehyde dehydrogenase [Xanthomonas translucens pv. graminis]WIH10021.1 glutamate-5-semialdehyde dehydrogenase [Xanthomonas translucens pv. graminis]WIH11243.1 glutamate-5-semialdehyde dehydrogenase [Xanthomonas translucens pv